MGRGGWERGRWGKGTQGVGPQRYGWQVPSGLHGRALTAQSLPTRPEVRATTSEHTPSSAPLGHQMLCLGILINLEKMVCLKQPMRCEEKERTSEDEEGQ